MTNNTWLFDGNETATADGAIVKWDDHQFFTLIYQGNTFLGELLEDHSESNELKIKINHRVFALKRKGTLDALVAAMGLDVPKVRKMKEVHAPMPGRILQIAVSAGQVVAVGDELLSLEAMKMENVLKAEGTGKVKAILVSANQVVEKGAVLIEFED